MILLAVAVDGNFKVVGCIRC